MAISQMYRVTQVVSGVAGSPYYMVGHFDGLGGTPQAAATDWNAFCRYRATGNLAGLRFDSITSVDFVEPVSGDIVGLLPVTVAAYTGGTAGEPLPPANQFLFSWRTGNYAGGREIRGRTNAPGYAELDNSAGVPSGTCLSAAGTAAATLIGSANSDFVVYSKKQGAHFPVVSATLPTKWAVLRTRRD